MNLFLNQNIISEYYFWLLSFVLIIFLLFFIYRYNSLKLFFGNISKKYLIVVLFIVFLSLLFRIFLINHSYEVFNDEYVLFNVAENFARSQDFLICQSRIGNTCLESNPSAWPPGGPFIYSFFLRTFGLHEQVIFFLNSIIGSLTVFLAFLLGYLFFKNEKSAFIFSILIAIEPFHLRLSGTAALGVISIFFLVSTIILFFYYLKNKTFVDGIFFLFALILFINIRIENIFVCLFFMLYYLFKGEYFNIRQNLIYTIIFLLLIIPFFQYILVGVSIGTTNWTISITEHINFLVKFFFSNIKFIFLQTFSIFFLVFFISGLILSLILKPKKYLPLFIWLIIVFSFLTSYPGGLFESGRNYRYIIGLLVPIFLFTTFLFDYLNNHISKRIIFYLLLITLLIYPMRRISIINSEHYLQKEYEELSYLGSIIDSNCLILTDSTFIVNTVMHKPTISNKNFSQLKQNKYFSFDCFYFVSFSSKKMDIIDYGFIVDKLKNITYLNENKSVLVYKLVKS